MRPQLVIRFLPLEILLIAALAGSGVVGLVRGVVAAPRIENLSAPVPALAPEPASEAADLSPVFTPETQHWSKEIVEWAGQAGVDPNLAATVMQIESCGDPQAESPSGAQGLFQVMPFHFDAGEAMQDPDTNARRGLAYLALGLERAGGQAGLALAGYNGGHSQIGKDGSLWPAETQRYYYWGTGIYDEAVSGAQVSSRLQEWLAAGGASLCGQAAQRLGLSS